MKRTNWGSPVEPRGEEPESGNNISNLSPQWPAGTEPISQGDDHLRATKRATVGSFPEIGTESVTLTEAEWMDGYNRSGEIGIIRWWYGVLSDIPTGWALCNGDSNTPDLQGGFIRGWNGDPDDSGDFTERDTSLKTTATELEVKHLPPHYHDLPNFPSNEDEEDDSGDDDDALADHGVTRYTSGTKSSDGASWPAEGSVTPHSHNKTITHLPEYATVHPIMYLGGRP